MSRMFALKCPTWTLAFELSLIFERASGRAPGDKILREQARDHGRVSREFKSTPLLRFKSIDLGHNFIWVFLFMCTAYQTRVYQQIGRIYNNLQLSWPD